MRDGYVIAVVCKLGDLLPDHAISIMGGVEELYKNFGILADTGEDIIDKHCIVYERIINASKGSSDEKKLAPGFITKFFRHFPSYHDAAMDAILDLIEDEDPQVRRLAIKSLPEICKGSKDDNLYVRVSDVLTQLLPIEDSTDLGLVKSSMAIVLEVNTKSALVGIFDQIMGEDETIREKGLQYISGPLMDLRHKLFVQHSENEQVFVEFIKKVLVDVTGEEFETLMEVLSKLVYISSSEGSRFLSDIINKQAELLTEFKAEDNEYIDKFTTCFRQAIQFYKHGSTVSSFLEYLCVHILPVMDAIEGVQTRQELLQLLAEACLYPITKETSAICIQNIYTYLVNQLPLPPEAGTDQPKLNFSNMECILFTFHIMCQKLPEFPGMLKDLRLRLQYFARGSQVYHMQLRTALMGKSAIDMKEEQNKLRGVALKTTENINALIKDFFHNPPSYVTTIALSWGAKKQDNGQDSQRKRPGTELEVYAKRKPSPIKFQSTDRKTVKKKSMSIYSPPRDKFSQTFSDETKYEGYQPQRRGGKGGHHGNRNRKSAKKSWRTQF